jgi:hypothetical protein
MNAYRMRDKLQSSIIGKMLKIYFAFVSRASGSDGLIACKRWIAAKTIGANADC